MHLNKRHSYALSLDNILIIVILFPVFAPIASLPINIRLPIIGLWLLTNIVKIFKSIAHNLYPYIIWLALNLLLYFLGIWYYGHYSFIYYFFDALLYTLPILMYFLYKDNTQKTTLMRNIIIVSLFIGTIITIVSNILIPGASRILASGLRQSEIALLLSEWGCKDFSGIYASVLLLPAIMFNIQHTNQKSIIWIVMFILTLVMIFVSDYTTAIILAIFAVAFGYALRHPITSTIISFVFILVLLSLAFDASYANYFLVLSRIDGESTELGNKLYDIYMTLKTTGAYGSVLSRYLVYEVSLESFRSSILFGAMTNSNGISGDHSSIFDLLACYGLFGFSLYFWHYVKLTRKYIKDFSFQKQNVKKVNVLKTVFLLYIILALLNPVILSTVIVNGVFLAVPVLLIDRRRD